MKSFNITGHVLVLGGSSALLGEANVRKLPADHPALKSCLGTSEYFCVVTQSVRRGIEIAVRVHNAA